MKLRSYGIVIVSVLVLLGSCFTAAATSISDGTGDIWHWAQTGTSWSWQGNVGNKPNIDITEVSYTVNEDKITLSLTVSGTIQTSDKVVYWVYYNTTDSTYWFTYTNGTGFGMGMQGMNITSGENVTVSGNSISVELDVVGDTTDVELWGWAHEYTSDSPTTGEWWGDWAPNSKFTGDMDDDTNGDTGDDTNGDDGNGDTAKPSTPGFELFAVIAAVAVALILLRRRR
jgi:hypothetical protein